MKSVGIPGVLGMTAGAMLAATLIPLTVAAPARAGCLPGDFDFCDPGATVTTTSLLFDPSGMDTSISNPADDFSADIFNNGAGTVNEFFVNSDPELGLGVPNAIEDIFTSPWGDLTYVIPDDFMPPVSG
jgi:hypothetical protein